MGLIDTYQIATMGQNYIGSYTLATNGILIDVRIEDAGPLDDIQRKDDVVRKKVSVVVTIDGVQYTESIIVEGRADLSVDDVKVNVGMDDKPTIGIEIV